ncbi:uncharacterized protein KIAA1522 homolog [Bombina bombina]|uniref:uncharacterized protein KIAA1522 homolog n=1 Tax=Bombina bombina TaxID=8345 RepID=UPI00235A5C07|nr:uncharacterized protein KIAA1522 homolog [Bombina bombina]
MSTETALPTDTDPLPPVSGSGTAELKKKKKRKAGTLRRALSWLRGRRKKKPETKQEGEDHSKVDGGHQPAQPPEEEPPDNVFFPSGRSHFLEEIHSQAQEGLKSLQRREKQQTKLPLEEISNLQDPPETINNGFRVRSLSCSAENADDEMSVRSEMIQRKGSTFRPIDASRSPSGKSGRKRKEKRATVMGVPHHIAAELGLKSSKAFAHRGINDIFPRGGGQLAEKIPASAAINGEAESDYVVIPTVDGHPSSAPHNGAHVSLAVLEHTEATLQRHIDRLYQDDSCIGKKSGYKMSPLLLRPKSLAVPGMTTHSPQSEPMSPVMSMSPQAPYMSKIIPNAVLPPMVDVVALSRSSVRTLSRCSLASASPASVRGSLHRGRGQSFSSETWSRSDSTETIVSDSSTISSQGGRKKHEIGQMQEAGLSSGRASPALSTGTQDGSDAASLCSTRSSTRSVSLRKSKRAPPPPKRTYSLHQQREMGLPPRPERKPASKVSNARDPWVPREAGDNEVFPPTLSGPKLSSPSRSDRTMSPSSGYSSQSGTPTLPTKNLIDYPDSPGSRRKTPPKPERSSLVKSSEAPSISLLPSADSLSPHLVSPARAGSSIGSQFEQIQVPPHPNVPAPSCPPPISKAKDHTGMSSTTPPPSHHPTPPPSRKSESDAENSHSTLEVVETRESLWPPPPPEAPDVQDLSMADFPPPEEELPPPPSLHSDNHLVNQAPLLATDQHKQLGEMRSQITTEDEKHINIAAKGPALVAVPTTTDPGLGSVPATVVPPPALTPDSMEKQHITVPPVVEPIPTPVPPAAEPVPASVPLHVEPVPASVPLAVEPVPASVSPPVEPVHSPVPPSVISLPLPRVEEPLPAPVVEPTTSVQSVMEEPPIIVPHVKESLSGVISSKELPPTYDLPPATEHQSDLVSHLGPANQSITYKTHFVNSACLTTTVDTSETTVPNKVSTIVPSSSEASLKSSVPPPSPVLSGATSPIKHQTPSAWKPASAPGVGIRKVSAPSQSVPSAPKEDVSLPIVTPSLLQMVRLRSVQVRGPQGHIIHPGLPAPQKPVRKSLSLRSPPGSDALKEEGTMGPTQSSSQKIPEPGHSPSAFRSPASSASFVFSRGTRKFVFEPPSSPESEASLKRELVTELKSHVGSHSPDGKPPLQKKPSKIPPPVARKPSLGHPRTPTTPTSGSNDSMSAPFNAVTTSSNGINVAATLAGQEQQHHTPLEQA